MTSAPEEFVGSYRSRVYLNGQLISTEVHEVTGDAQMHEAAEQAAQLLTERITSPDDVWLIECELMGSDDPERFVRFGTDTGGMIDPIQLPEP